MTENYYTVYHLHDDTSNVNGFADSCSNFKEYIKLAKKQGMKAIAFSNHGGIFDWVKKKQECDKAGIKYIHGIELYLCHKLSDDDRGGHIGLYAKNWDGVKELNSLISLSTSKGTQDDNTDRHMYYNPRISLEELMNTSNNIIVTTACLASPLNRWASSDNEDREAFNTLINWLTEHKDRCFLEVQYHNCESQVRFNQNIKFISLKTGIPLIAGTDTHSSSKYKAECRKILQKYKKSYYGEEDEFDLIWKTYDELVDAFKNQGALSNDTYMEAINNTNILANMVEDFSLDKAFKYPTLYGSDVGVQWKTLIYDSFNAKVKNGALNLPSKIVKRYEKFLKSGLPYEYAPCSEERYKKSLLMTDKDGVIEYQKKIIEEFNVMCKLGMESFMMFMSELITWTDNNGIPHGTGRGSVCGSVIAYITGITDVDPMLWDTIFSRFCNEDRVSLGDIDIDFAPEDREKVYKYIIERFTPEKTAYIAAFSTLQDRGCIDVLAGGLGYKDLNKVKEVKNKFEEYYSAYEKIIQEEVNSEDLVEEGIIESTSVTFDNYNTYMTRINNESAKKKAQKVKQCYEILIKENQDLFYYLDGLKGTIVAKGTHPSGMIGSPITLADNMGVFYKNGDINMPVSTCTMKAVDSLNYVKFDILGLKTVGIIKDACRYAGIEYPKAHLVDWYDKKVWDNMITSHQGVFQFEGDYAFSLLKDFKPTTINHMSMVNAALRPSGKSYRSRLIAGEVNKTPSEEIDKLLSSNRGYLIFQEDTIKFLTNICDFTGSAADSTRRCIDSESLIMMGNGNYKKIKDVKVGDLVQSFSNNNVSEFKPVTNVFNNGKKQTYKIHTQHGNELIATGNHKVLTQRGWVRVDNLTNNDYIMTPKKINASNDGMKPQQRLRESDMFMLGMLIGDGTLGDKSRLHFTNHEMALITKFEECVNLRLRNKNKCEFTYSIQDGIDVEKIYSVYIKSKNYDSSVNLLLKSLDLKHKAKNKIIPNRIMNYPKGGKILNLLAGLFNTDGGYNTQQSHLEYYSTSYMLTLQIKSLLEKYEIYSYVSKKYIKEYDYYLYYLVIGQIESLNKFKDSILPYMIGKKNVAFKTIINKANSHPYKFNYYLPSECKQEIIDMSKITCTSLFSIGRKINKNKFDLCVHKYEFGMSDTKARDIISFLYCPYTYRLLFADYLPVRIKNIELYDERSVYDIEVLDNHNYVANNLIVHNCIGKKDKEALESQLPKILEGYCNHSPKHKKIAEDEAKQFVQIIQDSAEYQFGYNHSTAYSMNGYECVMLRTYHYIEFVAAYLNRAENEVDTNNGVELAKQYSISINPIQFGKSLSEYTIDRNNNAIYKGIDSIKFCNSIIAEELMEISNNKYNTFPELLADIRCKTSVDIRQLVILTGLGFFEQFGCNKYLLDIIDIYNKFSACKIIKKDNMLKLGVSEYQMKKFAGKETEKQYANLNNIGLVNDMILGVDKKSMGIIETMKFEKEYLGYITYVNSSVNEKIYIVVEFKTYNDVTKPYIVVRSIKTGDEIKTRIKQGEIFRESPFGLYSVLKINGLEKEFKKRRNEEGKYISTDVLEDVLYEYEVIK